MHRCECPAEAQQAWSDFWYSDKELPAATHAAGACPGTVGIQAYRRGDATLWLCSVCRLPGDVALSQSLDTSSRSA